MRDLSTEKYYGKGYRDGTSAAAILAAIRKGDPNGISYKEIEMALTLQGFDEKSTNFEGRVQRISNEIAARGLGVMKKGIGKDAKFFNKGKKCECFCDVHSPELILKSRDSYLKVLHVAQHEAQPPL